MSDITDKSNEPESSVNLFANLSPREIRAIWDAKPAIDSSLKLLKRTSSEGQDILASLETMKEGYATLEKTKEYIFVCHRKISIEMDTINMAINKVKTFFPTIDYTLLDDNLDELVRSMGKLKKYVDALENLRRTEILAIEGYAGLVQSYSLITRKCFKTMLRSICGQSGGCWEDEYSDDEGSGMMRERRRGSDRDHNRRGNEHPSKMKKTEDRPVEEDTPSSSHMNNNLNVPSASKDVNDE